MNKESGAYIHEQGVRSNKSLKMSQNLLVINKESVAMSYQQGIRSYES